MKAKKFRLLLMLVGFTVTCIQTSCGSFRQDKAQSVRNAARKSNISSRSFTDTVLVPLNELPQVLSQTQQSTIILIKNGTYSNINVSLNKGSKNNVLIRAESPGKVVVTGESNIRIWGTNSLGLSGILFEATTGKNLIDIYSSNEVEVFNNHFKNCGSDRYGSLIRMESGSSNNQIYRNTFEGNKSMGIVVSTNYEKDIENTNNKIYNNYFGHIPAVKTLYPNSDGNGLEAIVLGQGNSGTDFKLKTSIYDNLFEDIIGDGSEIITVKSSDNYIFSNTFLNNKSGITIRLGDDCQIFNNYLENTTQGIRVFGYGHIIENNIIKDSDAGIQLPATNVRRGESTTLINGYHQQERVKIIKNVIINPRSAAFSIGKYRSQTNRKFMPRNLEISDNEVLVLDSTTSEYKIENEDEIHNLKLRRNRVGRFDAERNSSELLRSRGPIIRFSSRDKRVGTNWY